MNDKRPSLVRAGCARTRLRLVHGRFVVGHSRAFLFMIVVVRLSVESHSVEGTFRQRAWSGRDHAYLLQ